MKNLSDIYGMRKILICVCIVMTIFINSTIPARAIDENNSDDNLDVVNFDINESGVLVKYQGNDTRVVVPDTVKQIGRSAFSDCVNIEKIILPDGIIDIGALAFENCSKLSDINIPSSLTELDGSIFLGCTSLMEITIPKGITEVNWYSFKRGTSIERINVMDDNEVFSSIDGVIFNKDKTSLIYYPINRPDDTYIIPDSVTMLSEAGYYSPNLKHLVLSKNLTYDKDGNNDFSTGSLESFSVPSENKYYCDIDGVLFTKDKEVLLAYPEKKPGVAYMIPDGTKTLRAWSLSKDIDTDMELKYIFLPNSVTTIEPCVGFIGYIDGFGPNKGLVFFGKKGSVAETYTKEMGLRYGVYDPLNKNDQLLFDCTDLELGKTEEHIVNTIQWPSYTKEPVNWKTSKKSVATISKDGKITACDFGTAVITATAENGSSSSIKVLVKLPKPANVKAVKYSDTKNYSKITWSKVDSAKGYNVYLCDDFSGIIRKLGSTTEIFFIDKNVCLDKYTNYIVQAYGNNSIYDSEYSILTQIYIPSAPTNIKVNNSMEGSAHISWNVNSNYNMNYVIYRSNDKDGKYIKIGTTNWYTNYKDSEIEKGKTYYYKVRSYVENSNSTIYSNYSKPVKYSHE